MARTKQTAGKSTGGPAKRCPDLLARRPPAMVAKPHSSQADSVSAHRIMECLRFTTTVGLLKPSEYCCLCQDGGELWMCDEGGCNRAVCNACMEIPPEELDNLKGNESVYFQCIFCHWEMSTPPRRTTTAGERNEEGNRLDEDAPEHVGPHYVSFLFLFFCRQLPSPPQC
jgi:hypothetical protein